MCYCKEPPPSPSSIIPYAAPIRWQLKGPGNPCHMRPASLLLPAVLSQTRGQSDQTFIYLGAPCYHHSLGCPQVTPPHHAFGARGPHSLNHLPSGGRTKPRGSFRGCGRAASIACHHALLSPAFYSQVTPETSQPPETWSQKSCGGGLFTRGIVSQ